MDWQAECREWADWQQAGVMARMQLRSNTTC